MASYKIPQITWFAVLICLLSSPPSTAATLTDKNLFVPDKDVTFEQKRPDGEKPRPDPPPPEK